MGRYEPKDMFESLETLLATTSKDMSLCSEDVWVYGVIIGWDKPSINELKQKFPRISEEDWKRLNKYHKDWKLLKKLYSKYKEDK